MGYAVTGGILTVRHLAFGPKFIQTAIARDEKFYVSRAHLRVKNLNDMQPIWRGGKKRVVVGPTVRTESDEVTRDSCLLKDPTSLDRSESKLKPCSFGQLRGACSHHTITGLTLQAMENMFCIAHLASPAASRMTT